jgi:hypothetical protein
MTFNLHTFWCNSCKAATPHELSEDGQRARCITCLNKHGAQREIHLQSETQQHIAALDGAGNRGEK